MRTAVIGAGVAGLGAAWSLKDSREVVVYEQDARVGGHANTVTIDYDGVAIAVDTGFIVYNAQNYPNLCGLFAALDVETRSTDMSFACAGGGVEWSSSFPRGVFAQKRNLLRPDFLGMLADIGRFNALARSELLRPDIDDLTLGAWLKLRRFGNGFRDRYLLPMGAAIWSTTEAGIGDFPARSFLRFLSNHSLLQFRPSLWRTVVGGSQSYVGKLEQALAGSIRAGAPVVSVRRQAGGVIVRDASGHEDRFDDVILACHSDQARRLLGEDADAEEAALLEAIRYAPNRAVLHRDPRLMPERPQAWGSWNYIDNSGGETAPYVTYWMNNLQGIDAARPLFVSLNGPEPDPALTFGAYDYEHPQFDTAALAAQRRFGRIQGRGGVWYAGAWLGYGFHEDGITSGVKAALALGGQVPWAFVDHRVAAFEAPSPMRVAA
ncbi:MAG: FAD-dependent oxidoreductase [Caulobacter sp.]|nr:FAD-dependent oxidoreductase [Caulobacter sp.]